MTEDIETEAIMTPSSDISDGSSPMDRPQPAAAKEDDSGDAQTQPETRQAHRHPDASPTAAQPPPPKRRRSQAAVTDSCWTCRLRKVKCSGKDDSNGGSCLNCVRLDLQCSFCDPKEPPRELLGSRTTPSRSHTEAGTVRKRAQRACTECHSHKTRCSGDLPRCKRCETCNLQCKYEPAKRKFQHIAVNATSGRSARSARSESEDAGQGGSLRDGLSPEFGSPGSRAANLGRTTMPNAATAKLEAHLANKDLLLRHVDAFFAYLYYTPSLGIFHRKTTYQEIEDGSMSPLKAAAIYSVTAFFVSPGPEGKLFAEKCAAHVDHFLYFQSGSFKEDNMPLIALLVLHHYMMGKGNLGKCWDKLGSACRLMIGLQLCWEVHDDSKRECWDKEIRRRLAWLVFHLDRLVAGGIDQYLGCREEHMKVQLPCREDYFNNNRESGNPVPRITDGLRSAKSKKLLGWHGYLIRLMNIRHHVLVMSKSLARKPENLKVEKPPGASQVMSDAKSLQREIADFRSGLPPELQLSHSNIRKWLRTRECQVYVSLHVWICILHMDLYRFSLPYVREGSPELQAKLVTDNEKQFLQQSRRQAVAHAIVLARFWDFCIKELEQPSATDLLLLGDYNIMPCVFQCNMVLRAALYYPKLYEDLDQKWHETTAPDLFNEKAPINEESLMRLLSVGLRVSKPWADMIPNCNEVHVSLTRETNAFDPRKVPDDNDRKDMGPLGDKYDNEVRLPAPHYLMESAVASAAMQKPKIPSMAELFPSTLSFPQPRPEHPPRRDHYSSKPRNGEWEDGGNNAPPMPVAVASACGYATDGLATSDAFYPQQVQDNTTASLASPPTYLARPRGYSPQTAHDGASLPARARTSDHSTLPATSVASSYTFPSQHPLPMRSQGPPQTTVPPSYGQYYENPLQKGVNSTTRSYYQSQ